MIAALAVAVSTHLPPRFDPPEPRPPVGFVDAAVIESFYQWHKLLVRMRDVDKQYDEAARNIERRLKEFDEIETKAKPKPK